MRPAAALMAASLVMVVGFDDVWIVMGRVVGGNGYGVASWEGEVLRVWDGMGVVVDDGVFGIIFISITWYGM